MVEYKIKIRSKTHAKQVLDALYILGYKWRVSEKYSHLTSKYFYTHKGGQIGHGNLYSTYLNKQSHKDFKLNHKINLW